ncbi:hypothetical protein K9M79_04095 [Candidatus Woesearchaeota archaeon]|nr:hypothetical protein [Candidatus Woesearchaeota archaeon]
MIKWAEQKIKNLTIGDFAILKIVLVITGIVIGAYISDFVKLNVWYFIGTFIILYGYIVYRVLTR